MKTTLKKLLVSIVSVTLALTFMAVGTLADSSSSQGQQQGARHAVALVGVDWRPYPN